MARRVMEQLRGELYLDQRYLTAALGALLAAPRESGGSFATDGGALYYPTAWLLDTYRRNRRYLPRAYLHSLFHCIFRHLWLRDRRDPDLWGLACDIAVEATLDTLNTPATKRPVGWVRQQCYTQLREKCKFLAAGPIYRVLAQTDAETLNKWQREFYTDSHRLWPADPDSPCLLYTSSLANRRSSWFSNALTSVSIVCSMRCLDSEIFSPSMPCLLDFRI